MNVFGVAPEIKLSKNFDYAFGGYARAAYKMFFYDNNKVKADSVLLPQMSMKPYFEYGLGAKKDWERNELISKDMSSYAEVVRRDGGIEGWEINLGLKIDF